MTIAHQYIGQLSDLVRKTVFGNVGTIVNFRVGAEDAVILAEEYTPIFNVRDIINLGVREFYTKMSVQGELSEAFSGRTLDIKYNPVDKTQKLLIFLVLYCHPREEVEEMLKKWDEGKIEEPGAIAPKNDVIEEAAEFEMPLI